MGTRRVEIALEVLEYLCTEGNELIRADNGNQIVVSKGVPKDAKCTGYSLGPYTLMLTFQHPSFEGDATLGVEHTELLAEYRDSSSP